MNTVEMQEQETSLIDRAAVLESERGELQEALTVAQKDYTAYQAEVDNVLYDAEFSGSTKAADRAEAKLVSQDAVVRRKQAAIRAIDAHRTANTNALKDLRAEFTDVRIAEIVAEAESIAEGITLTDVVGWQRLKALWAEVKALGADSFTNPDYAFVFAAKAMLNEIGGNPGVFTSTQASALNADIPAVLFRKT